MLGNLSKVLIKAPSFFNNNMETIDYIDSSNNIQEGYTLNSLNSYNSKKDITNNSLYFRESDFWKHNFEPEINFNHNKRLSFSLSKELRRQKSSVNNNKINNLNRINRFNTIRKIDKYLLTNNQRDIKPYIKNNFSIYKNNSVYKKTFSENDRRLKTESNRLIKDKIKLFKNNLYNNIKYNYYESPKHYKFPKIHNIFKSQETLFQENTDYKFKTLKLIKPEIKEQLKTKNRSMVGKKEFLKYLRLNRVNLQNPFYESIKMKEDLNEINFKRK